MVGFVLLKHLPKASKVSEKQRVVLWLGKADPVSFLSERKTEFDKRIKNDENGLDSMWLVI
jgi:hypothetical protein